MFSSQVKAHCSHIAWGRQRCQNQPLGAACSSIFIQTSKRCSRSLAIVSMDTLLKWKERIKEINTSSLWPFNKYLHKRWNVTNYWFFCLKWLYILFHVLGEKKKKTKQIKVSKSLQAIIFPHSTASRSPQSILKINRNKQFLCIQKKNLTINQIFNAKSQQHENYLNLG